MSTTLQPLRYLFSAFFEGGASISQTLEDKSSVDESKSCFYDVMEKQKEARLEQFSLVGTDPAGTQQLIIVDFTVGRFYANGVDFSMEGQDEMLTDRKIVYFRENFQHTTLEDGTQAPYTGRYFIGYEGKNDKGRNVEKVLNIRA